MSFLEVRNISKSFGTTQVLHDLSFRLESNEIKALVGGSGEGKSTFLRILAGLESADSGELVLNEKVLFAGRNSVPANKRNIGLVFQDYALFPHMTVEENIQFGRKPGSKVNIQELISLGELQGKEKSLPKELSGGQQQRVALIRSLAAEPEVLLLDEPFSNLDKSLKTTMRFGVQKLLKHTGTAAILITHDAEDAMAVADSMSVLFQGKIIQEGSPEELFCSPNSVQVAKFFGELTNLSQLLNEPVFIRPEHITFSASEGVEARMLSKQFMGLYFEYNLDCKGVEIKARGSENFTQELVYLQFPSEHLIRQ